MDATLLFHAAVAVATQAAFGLLFGNWTAGAAFACCYFFGREVAQAEYRWIAANGGLRAKMPWYQGLAIHKWTLGSVLDVVAPVAACTAVWFYREDITTLTRAFL